MKSKEQKIKEVEDGDNLLKESKSVILISFSRIPVNAFKDLRTRLKEAGAKIKVMKKTLMSLIFKNNAIDIDANQFSGQVAMVFSDKDLVDSAGILFNFGKEVKSEGGELSMLVGYDIEEKNLYDAEKMAVLGQLPPKDVLLAQLVGMLSAPMRALAVVIKQIAEKKEQETTTSDIKSDEAEAGSAESGNDVEDKKEKGTSESNEENNEEKESKNGNEPSGEGEENSEGNESGQQSNDNQEDSGQKDNEPEENKNNSEEKN